MKACTIIAALLLASGVATSFAGTVELNGITSLFGENMAFLVWHETGQGAPVSFYLLEGQSRHGVKLLAVDLANRRVQVEEAGQTQYVQLSLATDLPMNGDGSGNPGQSGRVRSVTPEQQMQLDHFLKEDPDVQKLLSGAPIYTGAYIGAPLPGAGNSGNAPGGSSGGNASASGASDTSGTTAGSDASGGVAAGSGGANPAAAGSSAADTSSTATDYTTQPWYVASKTIELNRLNTAAQVLNGGQGPLPRTPLTPPNTPAALIGNDTFFANHIPGFPYGGSVDGWSDEDQGQ